MKILKSILIGILIGIANIIPGVSGGTLAISLGVYEEIIYSINHIIKEFKKSIKTLFPLGVGAVLAILLLSKLISYCFESYEVNTTSVFVGLILGAIPMLVRNVKGSKIDFKNIVCFILGFTLIAGLAFVGEVKESDVFPSTNLLIMLLVGMIASMTMIVPGVSGSMILALMGFYRPILNTINALLDKVLSFNFTNIWSEIFILTFFGIGVIIGIVVFARIIEMMFNKFKIPTFYVIIGIILASPIALLVNLNYTGMSVIGFVVMVVFAIFGFVCSYMLGEK